MKRELVADFVKEMFDAGYMNHLDGYGGSLFALEVDEAFEKMKEKGWTFEKKEECSA